MACVVAVKRAQAVVVNDEIADELALQDERAFVCPHCSAVLPSWPVTCFNWEHCDPRAVRSGIAEQLDTDYDTFLEAPNY
jgi:hypothetical protein